MKYLITATGAGEIVQWECEAENEDQAERHYRRLAGTELMVILHVGLKGGVGCMAHESTR